MNSSFQLGDLIKSSFNGSYYVLLKIERLEQLSSSGPTRKYTLFNMSRQELAFGYEDLGYEFKIICSLGCVK